MTEQVNLNEKAHTYHRKSDGGKVPSFSEIARLYFPGNPFWTDRGRAEGSHLHACINLLLHGDLDWSSVHESALARLGHFERFMKESGFKPELTYVEKPLFNPTLYYACTPDYPGYIGSHAVVIDAKRGAKAPWHRVQTAAQKMALAANGFQAKKRFSLYLGEDGYKLEPHDRNGDELRRDEKKWTEMVYGFHAARFYDRLA